MGVRVHRFSDSSITLGAGRSAGSRTFEPGNVSLGFLPREVAVAMEGVERGRGLNVEKGGGCLRVAPHARANDDVRGHSTTIDRLPPEISVVPPGFVAGAAGGTD